MSLEFTESQVTRVKQFVKEREEDPFVAWRWERNVVRSGEKPDRSLFWKGLISCLLTTRQKSGPGKPVWKFMHQQPFPLSYSKCQSVKSLEAYIRDQLRSTPGIQYYNKIANFASFDFDKLESGLWMSIDNIVSQLWAADSKVMERKHSNFLRGEIKGLGNKQARNLLQLLGLTKYEIPLDARIISWLNEFGFPVPLDSQALSSKRFYEFILDGVQELCLQADLYPCIFDAAVFSAVDDGGWQERTVIF